MLSAAEALIAAAVMALIIISCALPSVFLGRSAAFLGFVEVYMRHRDDRPRCLHTPRSSGHSHGLRNHRGNRVVILHL